MAHGDLVTLHVGTPKSGTTSLQNILSRNRALMLRHGLLYPGEKSGHFIEALSLRDSGFRGHHFDAAEGAWDRVVETALAHDGPVLLSHEIIGGSTRSVVKRAVRSFEGRRVRIVITCRDLARQLPAVWQEGVKNGDTDPYSTFLQHEFDAWTGIATAQGMWRGQNLASLVDRWSSFVDPADVHLVTVPPSGSSHDLLWQRFRTAVGLPDADYAVPPKPRNTSLGAVETELLRRIVQHLPADVPWPVFAKQVKRRLAQRRLAAQSSGGRLAVPEAHRARTAEIAEEMVAALRASGCSWEGDPDDLVPQFSEGTSPDEVGDGQLLERALELLAPLVLADRPQAEQDRKK